MSRTSDQFQPHDEGASLDVLLVEDNPADAAIVQAQLAHDGTVRARVDVVETLAEALSAVLRHPYQAILLDLHLPDSDGLDTFITLHTRTALTPVVVLSGLDEDRTVLDAVRMGAQDFLVKGSFTPSTLLRSLQFAIARGRLMARMYGNRSTDTVPAPLGGHVLHPDLKGLPLEPSQVPATGVFQRGNDRIATTYSHFSLSGGLGSGGMSEVVLAHQVNLGREVAVKFLRASHSDPKHLDQFQAEARVTAFLEHPCVVPVYDLGDTFFVMRRVQGTTLSNLLAMRNPEDSYGVFVEALVKVCDAVAYAHSKGIIHRDIKPDNIMVGDFGQVLLLDWGLALTVQVPIGGRCIATPMPTEPREVCAGTLGYLAPEIANADLNLVGTGTDVFLLGATLYCVLTGQPPFDGATSHDTVLAASRCEYREVWELAPSAPEALVRLQIRAMDLLPQRRGTVQEFSRDLRAWLMYEA